MLLYQGTGAKVMGHQGVQYILQIELLVFAREDSSLLTICLCVLTRDVLCSYSRD